MVMLSSWAWDLTLELDPRETAQMPPIRRAMTSNTHGKGFASLRLRFFEGFVDMGITC